MADYGINIGVNVQSGQLNKLTQQLKELRAIEKDLADIQKNGTSTQKKITDARRAAKDEINKNKKAALEAARSFTQFTGVLTKGSSALREQSAQFRAYRKGAKSAKDGWTTFTQAIVKSDFSAAFADLKRLNREAEATAKTFSLMAMGGGGPAFATGASMQKLLEFKPATTTNALQGYSNVLEQVIRQVDRGSAEYADLARRIREVNAEMSRTAAIANLPPTFANANAYGAPAGPALPPGMRMGRRLPSAGAAFRGNNRARDVLTGAGFPLLFGGGPAQALAGGIGGAVGGLGGSIAASAIVSQIEAFGQAIAKVGQSLNPLTFDLQTFASAAGISGTEVEGFLATIEKYGGKAQAAAEASKIFAMRIGKDATDALTKFGEDAQKLGNQLNTIFTTVMANIARLVGPLLSQLANALERGNLVRGFKEREGLTGRAAVAQQILQIQGRRTGKGAKGADIKRLGAQIGLTGTTSEILEAAKGIGAESQRTFESQQFAGLGQTAAALEAAAKEKKPKKTEAEKEAERLMRQRQRFEEQQAALIERTQEVRFRETQELNKQEDLLRAKLAGNEEEVRYAIELGELQEKYGVEEGRRRADQKARIRASTEALREQEVTQQRINTLVNSAGQQFAGLFETLINGTNDWNSALRNVLTSLSSALFRYGLSALGGNDGIGFFSALAGTFTGGKRALGGSVSANTPYMVGERGPELFVPGAQGNIVPNHAMGGGASNIVVNVDATGSSVEGNAQDSKRLGEAIGVAIRQELIKQKRPGGLLA